jgi:hypothetical protein
MVAGRGQDFEKLVGAEMEIETEYGYQVTVAAWFFMLIAGGILVFHGTCRRKPQNKANASRSPPHGER